MFEFPTSTLIVIAANWFNLVSALGAAGGARGASQLTLARVWLVVCDLWELFSLLFFLLMSSLLATLIEPVVVLEDVSVKLVVFDIFARLLLSSILRRHQARELKQVAPLVVVVVVVFNILVVWSNINRAFDLRYFCSGQTIVGKTGVEFRELVYPAAATTTACWRFVRARLASCQVH